jgi:hypothetical protein
MPKDDQIAPTVATVAEAGGEITVEQGADRDVLIEQHDSTLGETRSIWFDVRHAETICAAILAQARAITSF